MSVGPQDVQLALEALIEGNERSRRLVVRAGPHWQVVTAERGRAELSHRSARSFRLPESVKLNPQDAQGMRALEFAKRPADDWRRQVGRSDLGKLAAEIVTIVQNFHRIEETIALDLEIDDREHPENPELLAAMRTLADKSSRNHDTRQQLYNVMVNSRFLLPFAPEAGTELDPEDAVERVGERNGKPIFAGFSDFASLRSWRPLETDYLPSHGSVLFEWLCEENASSFLVNPDGRVGGELFGHELEMMAEGVRRFVKKHGV